MFDVSFYVKAVASPAKLFYPKIKGYNFQKAFHDLIGVTFPGHLVCWISTGSWCPDVLKIHVI